MKIVAVCGSGLGSSFLIEMNINETCKALKIDAEVSHINLGSFDPNATDVVVCGADLEDSIEFQEKIVLQNIVDKDETFEKIKKYFNK
ncbi:PTS system ascorbate-specific enzyme IIC/IIB [Spiroplasma clarkii]|uniref:PTS system, ascorbate-specific IIB component n=1 Tax=Spiroplasma clarkii TaxID=2139 RepID=A0A1Y0L134_9MOLU|nr:PTS sugar transporter subunit IIB [Spiroplasma clarkii]ARU91701.1 PTS system ascorbate-specific enzyme IIC/IIB [Spiroplasma clarkii]ATX71091.1 PTS system, ascorbate-specific IIB component [Spiroplasma clarkii]